MVAHPKTERWLTSAGQVAQSAPDYSNEIKRISEFVCSNHNLQVQSLAQAINKIFVETFGTDVYDEDLEQCALMAKRILSVERE